jgi:hypothetical protein
MAITISGRDMFRQLKADLIGKDSHRGVTFSYAWLANQFGHISLGFIPTFILYILLPSRLSKHDAAIWSATIVSVFWLLFETYNFLGPLLSKRKSQSKVLFIPKNKYTFEPAWKNIAFDTFTDLLFFWFGAFLCSIICFYSVEALIVLLILLAFLIYPPYYWYLTKMYLQVPQYPYQFRLSQWDYALNEDDKKKVYYFLSNQKNGLHLFLFGSKGSGKTSLSIGIATELSIRHQACVYTTAMKLYSMFFEPDILSTDTKTPLWSWRSSSVLVIDDINPGDPIKEELVSPLLFLSFLDTFSTNEINRAVMERSNVIWVLGDKKNSSKELFGEWQAMLNKIGVPNDKILAINL